MDLMPSLPAVNEQSTDLEIFLGIQAQRVKALDLLYDRYSKLVYSTAVQILNNIEEAEDCPFAHFRKVRGIKTLRGKG
jgi:hypothetical protein